MSHSKYDTPKSVEEDSQVVVSIRMIRVVNYDVSSKPVLEIGPPKKRMTFRQTIEPLVTLATKEAPKRSRADMQESFKHHQCY